MTQHTHQHRISTCTRHPTKPITGFCAACLRERLAGIDPDTHLETPITHLATELRRSKSLSSTSNPNASSSSTNTATTTTSGEPRRKSCDVRNHGTLSDLFGFDDNKNGDLRKSTVNGVGFGEQNGNLGGNGGNVEIDFEENGEFRTVKEFIDLEWEKKRNSFDLREIVTSVFSKRVLKWQLKDKKKEKEKKQCGIDGFVRKEGSFLRKFRETQSEVGEYGVFGRRSCDTDPRLSVDVARISVDDSRYSFDEPRASWDGYLIGKTCPPLRPLVSVVEDVNLQMGNGGDDDVNDNVGLDKNGGECSPGGTAQTRDYYSDRRTKRRSFDRSGSHRRMSLGDDELKLMSNAKVSPETVGLFHGAKLLVTEEELRDSNWYSLNDCHKEGVVSLSKDVGSGENGVRKKGFKFKKPQSWRGLLNIWGMMQRRGSGESKCRDDESSIGPGNVVNEPVAESWQKFNVVANGEANGNVSQKLLRSYTVSAKDSCRMTCSSMNEVESKDNITKKRDDLVLQRNRSVRYSPNHLDNGLLRFYLTPLRSYGRNKPGVSRLKNSNSAARNVL